MALIIWAVVFVTSLLNCCQVSAQSTSDNTAVLYHHRSYHASIVIGDYLYIDGGEITTWNGIGNGFQDDDAAGNITTLPQNYTYAIDLTSPWTNESVVLHQISKSGAPVLNAETLWPDSSGKAFYAYNGGVSPSYPNPSLIPVPPGNALYQFTPSANGDSGQWNQAFTLTTSIFGTLSRTMDAASGFGGGLGVAIGGVESGQTDAGYLDASYFTPGMVVFNTSSQEWYNISIEAISYSQTASFGAVQFVPSFGPAGLFFMLGGESFDERLVANGNTPSNQSFSFTTVPSYEPLSQKWYDQTANGQAPTLLMDKPCVVGIEGDDGTYEIFLYGQTGGWYDRSQEAIESAVVYVLSLPSFHWQKQNAIATYSRNRHTCHIIGSSQMVVIGGAIVNTLSSFAADPWKQGIGVFNLSTMEWSNSYDPSAPKYVTPQIVKDYTRMNRYPSSWSDPTVERWFTEQNSTNEHSPTPSSSSSGGSNHAGAIAGGVVGGLIVLAIIAGAVYLTRRRRRQLEQKERNTIGKPQVVELETEVKAQEVAGDGRLRELDSRTRQELEGGWRGRELDSRTRQELEGGWRGRELDSRTRQELESGWRGHELRGT